MIGMIIIDDEPLIRTTLSGLIDYNSIGVTLKGTASSAEEAFSMIDKDTAIVTVDIKMPGMSGVEFIDIAKKKFPWLHFIALSGYDDFEYVKKMFKLGAEDYFLKTELDPIEFQKTLVKIIRRIQNEGEAIQKQTDDGLSGYFKYIIGGRTELISHEAITGSVFHGSGKHLMVVSLLDYHSLISGLFDKSIQSLQREITDIFNRIIAGDEGISFFQYLNDEYVFILAGKNQKQSCYAFFQEIASALRHELCCRINGGISSLFQDIAQLPQMYQEARRACEYCYIKGNGILLQYNEFAGCTGEINVAKNMEKIYYYLTTLQFKEFQADIERLFCMDGLAMDNVDQVKQYLSQVYYEIKTFIQKNYYDVKDEYKFEIGRKAQQSGGVREFMKWIDMVLGKMVSGYRRYNLMVSKAVAYAHKNYGDPALKLNTLAKELFVTYNHLSRLFKTETGTSFNQYLTELRMHKALELISNSDLKLYEISQRVGYLNYENFSRTFKNFYGRSPKQIYTDKREKTENRL